MISEKDIDNALALLGAAKKAFDRALAREFPGKLREQHRERLWQEAAVLWEELFPGAGGVNPYPQHKDLMLAIQLLETTQPRAVLAAFLLYSAVARYDFFDRSTYGQAPEEIDPQREAAGDCSAEEAPRTGTP